MNKVFTEENGCYKIDCSKAIWATDSLNHQYHSANCLLSDVDWIMETNQKIYLVEYKNANISGAKKPEAFIPTNDKTINKDVNSGQKTIVGNPISKATADKMKEEIK